MLLNLSPNTSDDPLLSDHQHDGSPNSGETPQEEDALPLLTGRVRVMMAQRGDDRSAFEPDLCSHNGEKPTISNEGVMLSRCSSHEVRPLYMLDMGRICANIVTCCC